MKKNLLIEVGLEELPADMMNAAMNGLRDNVLKLLKGLEYGAVRIYGTPRRLAVAVEDVESERPSTSKLVTGPPADRAFKDGKPTGAAMGFARGKGVDVSELEIVDGPKGKVIAARVTEGGESTVDLIAQGLEQAVSSVPFKKSMEWGNGGVRYGRPLHWVVALFGGDIIPATIAGIETGRMTRGHRLANVVDIEVTDENDWLEKLRTSQVEPGVAVRRQRILDILDDVTEELGSDPIADEELLEEVVQLVEWPVKTVGVFDADLLNLPPRLLITSMKVHQRYFPVHKDGKLTNSFVIISNNPFADPELVADGNARVIRARFYDAKFFLHEDRQRQLAEYVAGLERMRWIRGLGTVADKQRRIAALGAALAPLVGADPEVTRAAGLLTKADLTTQMVGEFPELQGYMGRLYADVEGQNPAIGLAIEEHYHPRFAGDSVAQSPAGIALSLADRLDTLVSCFGVGMKPKGGDPQGLRRAALGVVTTLVEHGIRVDLSELIGKAIDLLHADAVDYPGWVKARGGASTPNGRQALIDDLVGFFQSRLVAWQASQGTSKDVVEAAVAVSQRPDPVVLVSRIAALRDISGTPAFPSILELFKRVLNITKDTEAPMPSAADLTVPAEEVLFQAVTAQEPQITGAIDQLDFQRALEHTVALEGPVAAFFDAVMVNDDDPKVRAVRLGILNRIADLFRQVADFARITTG